MTLSEANLVKGDKVRLKRLDEDFFKGLDDETIENLRELVGKRWTYAGRNDLGQAELEYWYRPRRVGVSSHTVWVPDDWIERVS